MYKRSLTSNEVDRLLTATATKAYNLCQEMEQPDFNLLHDVVTLSKHAQVSLKLSGNNFKPQGEHAVSCLLLENYEAMKTEDNKLLLTESSKVTIYYGEKIAKLVLQN